MHPVIYLVRHGETVWNREGRLQGRLDSPLTPHGREQAAQVAASLVAALGHKPRCRLVSSPLGRARATAARIAAALELEPEFDQRLAELSMGSWSGLTRAEIEAGWPEALQGATEHEWYFRSPDGETLEALCVRLSAWLREQRGPTIAVSHGLAGKVLRGVYAGLSESAMLRQPELQDRVYVLRDGTIRLLRSGPRHAPHGLSGWKP